MPYIFLKYQKLDRNVKNFILSPVTYKRWQCRNARITIVHQTDIERSSHCFSLSWIREWGDIRPISTSQPTILVSYLNPRFSWARDFKQVHFCFFSQKRYLSAWVLQIIGVALLGQVSRQNLTFKRRQQTPANGPIIIIGGGGNFHHPAIKQIAPSE